MTTSTLPITRFARVIVPVADQDRAIAFYEGVLGFEKIADVPFGDPAQPGRWVEVAPPGGGTVIALAPPMGAELGGEHAKVCLSFQTGDLGAVHEALAAAGAEPGEIMEPGAPAPPMFFFRDPDGNALHVTEES